MTLFQKAAAWLPAQDEAADGTTLTITRGAASTDEVPACRGRVAYRLDSEDGRRVQLGDRDYLIRVEEYVLRGETVLPALGDRFTETGAAEVYELLDPGNGEPAWRYSDETNTRYRLHVKKVTP